MNDGNNTLEDEDLLTPLLRDLYRAMKRLSRHALVSKPAWANLHRTWEAIRRNDVGRFEQSINDLDSLIHLHHYESLDREIQSAYLVVRHLIRCVQESWPLGFEAH